MLRYLLIGVLIALPVFADWFKCDNGTSNFDETAWYNPGWIPWSELCDGVRNCDDASDEAIHNCKIHPKYTESAVDKFYCIYGANTDRENYCDGKVDCIDGSDEMGCDDENEPNWNKYRGNCSETQVECKYDKSCIARNLTCDNKYDCRDGWDESLELCYRNCQLGEFQCGNGACINSTLLCDNKPDCLDGADEFRYVCQDEANYIQKPLTRCTIPSNRHFDGVAKILVNNSVKFVLPTMPARIRCPSHLRPKGNVWNVCKLDGTWAFPMLRCMQRHGD